MIFKIKKQIREEYARIAPGNLIEINKTIYEITEIRDGGYNGDVVMGVNISFPAKVEQLFNLSGLDYYIDNGTIKLIDNA